MAARAVQIPDLHGDLWLYPKVISLKRVMGEINQYVGGQKPLSGTIRDVRLGKFMTSTLNCVTICDQSFELMNH